MKPICCMCGRRTTPFAFIGIEAIGPSCAKRMGLTKAKTPKASRVRFVEYKPKREDVPQTLDMFEGIL